MLNQVRGVLVLPAPFPPPGADSEYPGSSGRGPIPAGLARTPNDPFCGAVFSTGVPFYIGIHCDLHRNGGPAAVLTDSGMMHQSGTMRSFDDAVLMFESIERWPMIVMDFERAV